MKLRVQLAALGGALSLIFTAVGQVTGPVTWSSNPTDGTFGQALNWSSIAVPTATDDILFSSTSNATITVAAGATVNSVTFDSTAPTYSLGSSNSSVLSIGVGGLTQQTGAATVQLQSGLGIDLSANQIWNVNGILFAAGPVTGNGALEKQGFGQLIVTGDLSPTGGITVTNGNLQFGGNGTTGSYSGSIVDNATVTFNRSDNYAAGNISGTGQVRQINATGTLTLSGNNTYTGATVITGGTLTDSAANAFSSSSQLQVASGANVSVSQNETIQGLDDSGAGGGGVVTIAPAATLTLTANGSFSGAITGSGGLNLDSAGGGFTETLSGANDFTGGTYVGPAATLQLAQGAGSTGGTLAIGNITVDGTLNVNRANAITLGGISGLGQVQQNGLGTLTLSTTNTYSGPTVVSAGTLTDANPNAFSAASDLNVGGNAVVAVTNNETIGGLNDYAATSGMVTIAGGTTLTLQSCGSFSGVISGSGSLALDGTNKYVTESLYGANTYTGGTHIGSNTALTLQTGGSIPSGNITVDGTLVFNSANNVTYSGITGAGSVQQAGAGTVNLTGTNGYSGPTQVRAGTLADLSANAFSPNSSVEMYGGAVNVNQNESIAGLGDWAVDGTLPGTVTIASGATLTLTQGSNAFSGAIQGAGALSLTNSAFQTFTGNLTHTGGTTISAWSELQIGNGGTTGFLDGTVTNNGTLNYDRTDIVLTGTGISGAGEVIQNGSGTLTLHGTNSYSGDTSVNQGTINDAAANSFSPNSVLWLAGNATFVDVNFNEAAAGLDGNSGGLVTIANSTTLTLDATNKYGSDFWGTVAGGGALQLTGGWQSLSGANSYTGGTSITGGTLVATNASGSATGTGAISIGKSAALWVGDQSSAGAVSGDITNNGELFFLGGGTAGTYAGVISGSGRVNVGMWGNSPGNVTLTGQNTYTGQTIIGSGTLTIGAVNTLPVATNLTFGPGGSLNVQNDQTVAQVGSVDQTATIQIGAGTTFTVAPASSTWGGDFHGAINGAGSVTLAGASGTGMMLDGVSTYSGGTTVTGGTLYLGSDSVGSIGAVTAGPIGIGTLTLQDNTALAASKTTSSDISIANDVVLGNNVTLSAAHHDSGFELSGHVTIPTGNVAIAIGRYVLFTGTLAPASGTSALTVSSAPGGFGAAVTVAPANANITSITANNAGVIFGSAGSIPTSGTVTANGGYIGLMAASGYTTPTFNSLLPMLPKTTFNGTLGFDSGDDNAPLHVFTDNVDLTGFTGNVTLGSVTNAVISGTITPAGSAYAFGNGGGVLVVRSPLSGAYDVTMNSSTAVDPNNTLYTVFQGNNSFTGNVTVTNSVAVLDAATALPSTAKVNLGANGYVGVTEASSTPRLSDFISQNLSTTGYTSSSVLGLDSTDYIYERVTFDNESGERHDGQTIDLSGLSSIYLGTATQVVLNGTIIAPNQGGANHTLSLLAAKEGMLTISAPLTSANVSSVVVGSTTAPYADGTVNFNAMNTYTGGTKLLSGSIAINQYTATSGSSIVAGPLGTGVLSVDPAAQKVALFGNGWLANNITLGSALQVGAPSGKAADKFQASTGTTSTSMTSTSSLVGLAGIISDMSGYVGSLNVVDNVGLYGANTFSGGVNLQSGFLELGNDQALGTGPLTISSGWTNGTYTSLGIDGNRTIANNVIFNGIDNQPFSIGAWGGSLTVNGSLTLNNDLQLAVFSNPGNAVYFNGGLAGPGDFTVTEGTVVFDPASSITNTATGLIDAKWSGKIIFGAANALPTTGNMLRSEFGGYIGIGFIPTNLQSGFVDQFDKGNTAGTIGFDSQNPSSPNTFSDPIDLRGFSVQPTLGSSTAATLAGAITPTGSVYLFGGGGGALTVTSNLTDDYSNAQSPAPRSLSVTSASNSALTLRLTGTANYTGGTVVSDSGLIFGSGITPGNASITASSGAYVGSEDSFFINSPNSYVARFSPTSQQAIVGFDTAPGNTTVQVASAIDLTPFGSTTNPNIFLGTASSAVISGAITLPNAQSAYEFAGFKGGQLTVTSQLTDGASARSVVIGSTSLPATFGSLTDATAALSRVTLSGNNLYTGGTTLNAGTLGVGSDTALGTGTLTIATNSGASYDQDLGVFAVGTGPRTLSNAIAFSTKSVLDVGGPANLTLAGSISGSGTLNKVDTSSLTLSGDNHLFSGEIYIREGSITFAHAISVGSTSLEFGLIGGNATFAESSTINGLSGDSSLDTVNVASGTALTISQQSTAQYDGSFSGSSIGLNFNGPAKLILNGGSTFTGSATVNGGVVLANNAAAFGAASNSVTVNGGKLAVGTGITLVNPVTFNAGVLGGAGTFKATSAFDIKSGGVLSPGFGNPGKLTFDGSLLTTSALILDAGGTYGWKIADASNFAGWDTVSVNGTVSINATSSNQFTLSLTSFDSNGNGGGYLPNFDPFKSYSWTILSATHITGFSANSFLINASNFKDASGGVFSVALDGTGNNLMLNFTPVPEPSTYALLIAGLGLTFFASRRRRRG